MNQPPGHGHPPPTGPLARLGAFTARRRAAVLRTAVLLLALAALIGSGLPARLSPSEFFAPAHAESERALTAIAEHIVPGGADTIAIFRSDTLTVDDPAFGAAVRTALAEAAAEPQGPLTSAAHYWNTGENALLSADRHSACAFLALAGTDGRTRAAAYEQVRRALRPKGLTVQYTGRLPVTTEFDRTVDHDLTRAELLAFPLLALLLLVFFRSLTAAALPLAVAGASLLLSRAVLRLLTPLLPITPVTCNVSVMIALGLSTDYALFMVARFRRELRRRPDPRAAVAATAASAGHTVLYSATVISLATVGLTLLPFPATRSLGVGAAVTVALAGVTSLTLLPAALAALGPRIDSGRLHLRPRSRRRPGPEAATAAFWHRLGRTVVRHPVPWLAAVTLALAVLGMPAAHLRLGASDQNTLPAASPARQGAETLQRDFPAAGLDQLQVVVRLQHDPRGETGRQELARWSDQLTRLPGVRDVRPRPATARLALLTVAVPDQRAGTGVVRAIRSLAPPEGGQVLVGGPAAQNTDTMDALLARVPLLIGYLLLVTGGLLLLAFRSVVVPLKAVITTTMSLGVAFAAVTWTIQDGHGTRVLAFHPVGYVGVLEAAVMLMYVFSLSIDYELFLVSHIREQHVAGRDNESAIVAGLGRTGGLITAAAALIVVVAAAFATSPVITVKEIALGVVVAVTVDATLVRMFLVPASLRLLGGLNWWLPTLLRRGRVPTDPAAAPAT